MRNFGNFQQPSLMQERESGTRRLLVCMLATGMLTTVACTRMPVSQSDFKSDKVNTGKMQVVADTLIGTTARYVDASSGVVVEISVLSEYFSAGGRKCRKFLQGGSSPLLSSSLNTGAAIESDAINNVLLEIPSRSHATTNRLACEDGKKGWIEIPIHSIAG